MAALVRQAGTSRQRRRQSTRAGSKGPAKKPTYEENLLSQEKPPPPGTAGGPRVYTQRARLYRAPARAAGVGNAYR